MIKIIGSKNKFCLSMNQNGNNSFLYPNCVKLYELKAKYSGINPHPLCLGNISKIFTVDNMKKLD